MLRGRDYGAPMITSPCSLWDGYLVDVLSSAALVGFGMAVVAGVSLVIRR